MLSPARKTINEHRPGKRSLPMTRPIRLALIALLLVHAPLALAAEPPKLDPANTAWMLTASVLVLFMTLPGLALFYGGLVRAKNVLSVLMQCFSIACVVTIAWVVVGYSIAFADGGPLNAWYGGFSKSFLAGIDAKTVKGSIPETVFAMFQLTFAIITPALVIGAYAERVRYSGMLLFSLLWLLLVYCPVAHWVWGDGWLAKMGLMDFAGGTVVHLNAGIAALVCALFLGRRKGFPESPMPPHNLAMTVTGACMLWVGWFGFNAGSALAADGSAGMAMLVTHIGAATGSLAWMICEWLRYRKPSVLGIVTGMVAGLGTITPASGFVGPLGALVIGAAAGTVCFACTSYMKQALKVDDSLDVFPVHGVGGALGTILTGIFVSATFGGMGLPEKMSMGDQLLVQVTGVIAVGAWSGVITLLLLKLTNALTGFRATPEEETEGLDTVLHNEKGYNL
jgi:ammonium transporter, Amt family